MSSKTMSSNISPETSSVPSENSPNSINNQAGFTDNTVQSNSASQSAQPSDIIEENGSPMPSSKAESLEQSQLSSKADYEAEIELEDFEDEQEDSADSESLEVHAEHTVTTEEAGQRIDK